jgi:hypothetical protein
VVTVHRHDDQHHESSRLFPKIAHPSMATSGLDSEISRARRPHAKTLDLRLQRTKGRV